MAAASQTRETEILKGRGGRGGGHSAAQLQEAKMTEALCRDLWEYKAEGKTLNFGSDPPRCGAVMGKMGGTRGVHLISPLRGAVGTGKEATGRDGQRSWVLPAKGRRERKGREIKECFWVWIRCTGAHGRRGGKGSDFGRSAPQGS